MMNFDGVELHSEFRKAFGKDISELTVAQLWWLVKCIKHCRGRCRSNAALNNWLNRNCTGARFETVVKEGRNRAGQVEEYDGLEITLKERK